MKFYLNLFIVLFAAAWAAPSSAAEVPAKFIEQPLYAAKVSEGAMPAITKRLPKNPFVVEMNGPGQKYGRYGGNLRMLMARQKDIRMMVVYGYARLVGYDKSYNLRPDILEKVDVEKGRVFTLHLRKGHKWSDGHPFTAEDFRFYWEDIAIHKKLSKSGPPLVLLVDGKKPKFEILDETTVRYSWEKPNPFFLPALARARPRFIYAPSHYLKQFHAKYEDKKKLKKQARAVGKRTWRALFFAKGRQYQNSNPDLPTLQPWKLATTPPAQRFIFTRNPYFHRVDAKGRQLPYIDRVIMNIANNKLIAAKAGAGEADLQARNLNFNNYTFLKQGAKRNRFKVLLWGSARGSQMALFPNLNITDPGWRSMLRMADFRRALSLAINRAEINQVVYFGLARPGNNTVLNKSPLFKEEYAAEWAQYDLKRANKLLDKIGLTKRDDNGLRLMADGRPLEIIVETAGEDTEQTDILQLIHDSWLKIGVKLYTKPLQREVFRNRIFAGSTQISVWFGVENGVPTAESDPAEFVPSTQYQYQWPKWGQYVTTGGKAGEPVDMKEGKELAKLGEDWRAATDRAEKEKIWHRILKIHADNMFTIGIVSGVPQPIVVKNRVRNVPVEGIYNWDPGAHFGIHRPDTFWLDKHKQG